MPVSRGHKCRFCPRLFDSTNNRNRHEREIHGLLNQIPTVRKSLDYPCRFCNKSFATEGAVKSHEAVDHQEDMSQKLLEKIRKQETYDCDICNLYKTPTEKNLRRHFRIVHRLEHDEIDRKIKHAKKLMMSSETPEVSETRERIWCNTNKPSIVEISKAVDLSAEFTPFQCAICKTGIEKF